MKSMAKEVLAEGLREKMADASFEVHGRDEKGEPLRPDSAATMESKRELDEFNEKCRQVYLKKSLEFPELTGKAQKLVENMKKAFSRLVNKQFNVERITDGQGKSIIFHKPDGDNLNSTQQIIVEPKARARQTYNYQFKKGLKAKLEQAMMMHEVVCPG